MATLEIRLFGTLSLTYGGRPLPRLPSKRVKNLLSYLLLYRDDPHPREKLAALFWGELDDRKARHCLNTALWRLNQVLSLPDHDAHPYLRVDSAAIGFNTASDFRLDVAEFEGRCQLARGMGDRSSQQQADLYHHAVDVYSADLLTDCYEEWCLLERERLVRLRLRALGHLLEYHSENGERDTAVECGLRILACDPLREEVHRDVIRLYLGMRQPSDALRQYRACADTLRRELGIEPMHETQSLLGDIAASTESDIPVSPHLPISQPMPGSSTLSQNLAVALGRLHEAAAAFESAHAQLLHATARVKEIADGLGLEALTTPHPDSPGAGVPQFQRGRQLIAEATRNLEKIAG